MDLDGRIEALETHKIMAMEAEKRERILNAVMTEFCKGYKNASTDVIVRKAGISKGLLFHYFGTKKALYDFTVSYACRLMVTEFFGRIDLKEKDLLERLRQTMLLKMDLSYQYPAIFEFMMASYSRMKDDPSGRFAEEFKRLREGLAAGLFENIDASLFRDGIDIKKASNIIWWTLMGYSNFLIGADQKLRDYQENYERYLAEVKGYFDLFRKAFYQSTGAGDFS